MKGHVTLRTNAQTRFGRGGLSELVAMARRAIARGETIVDGKIERYNLSSGYVVAGTDLVARATRRS